MPFEIDQEALDSPNMKILDINRPPVKSIAHQSFPKIVYLHPKDKTKQHRHKTVHNAVEFDEAEKQGWKTKPHIPEAVAEDLSVEFEAEAPKRGPGRPSNAA
jgi:hypothetical protein